MTRRQIEILIRLSEKEMQNEDKKNSKSINVELHFIICKLEKMLDGK